MQRLSILLGTFLFGCALAAQPASAATTPAAARELARGAMSATGFTLGTAGPLLVAFEDPNCIFCEHLSRATAPLVAAGKLRIRIVPVGFLKPDSAARAAAILQAPNPAEAWERNMAGFREAAEEGAYPTAQPSFSSDRALRANLALLEKSGKVATPTLLVCRKGSQVPAVLPGIAQGELPALLDGAGSVSASGACQAN